MKVRSLIGRKRWVTLPVGSALCALFLAASATTAATGATGTSTAASAPQASSKVPAVNWALSGQATAGASQAGNPAANAIDGNAATSWCTNSWPDTLTV